MPIPVMNGPDYVLVGPLEATNQNKIMNAVSKIHFKHEVKIGSGYICINGANVYTTIALSQLYLVVKVYTPRNKEIVVSHDCNYSFDYFVKGNQKVQGFLIDVRNASRYTYSWNCVVEKWFKDHDAKLMTVSDAQYTLPRVLQSVAYREFEGYFDKDQRAFEIEDALKCDICDVPQNVLEAYSRFVTELCDGYYAHCFACQLCCLDCYDGQPVRVGDTLVLDQNPAMNV